MGRLVYVREADGTETWIDEADLDTGAAPGGSSADISTVRVPIAYNTPNLVLTGISIYTPTAGDVLLMGFVSVTTAWDGASPKIWLYPGDIAYTDSNWASATLNAADFPISAGSAFKYPVVNTAGEPPMLFTDATPFKALIDDNAGGDPGSTVGAGEIVLYIGNAA